MAQAASDCTPDEALAEEEEEGIDQVAWDAIAFDHHGATPHPHLHSGIGARTCLRGPHVLHL